MEEKGELAFESVRDRVGNRLRQYRASLRERQYQRKIKVVLLSLPRNRLQFDMAMTQVHDVEARTRRSSGGNGKGRTTRRNASKRVGQAEWREEQGEGVLENENDARHLRRNVNFTSANGQGDGGKKRKAGM